VNLLSTSARWARRQRGSALTEGALIFPVLIILLFWAVAMTDIMVVRLKMNEASRFATWETTVFRTPAEIGADVAQRFRDLRSPATVNSEFTGLLLYPMAKWMRMTSTVSSTRNVSIGGTMKLDNPTGVIDRFLSLLLGAVTSSVDGATGFFRFNRRGSADVRISMRTSHLGSKILMGGDLVGNRGGNDLDHSEQIQNLTFAAPVASHNPNRLVYDTWKAWPKPASFTTNGAPSNSAASPVQTYLTVEQQVAAQVNNVAFYGARQSGLIARIDNFMGRVNSSGLMTTLFGGTMPTILATSRMDANTRGPITIRPVAQPNASWVPSYRPGGGLQEGSHRLGEIASHGGPVYTKYPSTALIDREDPSRYTVPYQINSQYFTQSGGNDRNSFNIRRRALPASMARNNEYVRTYQCRGHFFAGGITAQQENFDRRYRPNCYQR